MSNERLEFLGDAILGFIAAEVLFTRFPEADEGWLSRARASVVRASTLSAVGEEIGLGAEIQLGKGEEATGGREKPSILADAMEALIGAAHLDGGPDASRSVVIYLLGERLDAASGAPWDQDDKSRLQEHVSRIQRDVVRYAIESTGPEHDKVFRAEATVGGTVHGRGAGRSKKQAEQVAARDALGSLLAESDGERPPLASVRPLEQDIPATPPPPAGPAPAPNEKAENA